MWKRNKGEESAEAEVALDEVLEGEERMWLWERVEKRTMKQVVALVVGHKIGVFL